MKVLVFGNVGSGKTTVLSKFKEVLPFDIIAIDDFRRKHSDGSKEGELIAREKFFAAIEQDKNQFIECIGVGEVADELYNILEKNQELVLCLVLLTPKEICQERLSNRVWDIPFPHPLEKVFSLIEKTENKIQKNEIANKWNNRKNTLVFSKSNVQQSDADSIVLELTLVIQQHI